MRDAAPGPANTADVHRLARGILNFLILNFRQLVSVGTQRCARPAFRSECSPRDIR